MVPEAQVLETLEVCIDEQQLIEKTTAEALKDYNVMIKKMFPRWNAVFFAASQTIRPDKLELNITIVGQLQRNMPLTQTPPVLIYSRDFPMPEKDVMLFGLQTLFDSALVDSRSILLQMMANMRTQEDAQSNQKIVGIHKR